MKCLERRRHRFRYTASGRLIIFMGCRVSGDTRSREYQIIFKVIEATHHERRSLGCGDRNGACAGVSIDGVRGHAVKSRAMSSALAVRKPGDWLGIRARQAESEANIAILRPMKNLTKK